MKKSLCLYIAVVLLAGLIIHGPTLQYPGFLHTSTHDGFIAMGDHGRDFYAYAQAREGGRPYRDFSWVYGPLMPTYYGLMMRFLGNDIPGILAANLYLQMLAGVLFFLLCTRLMTPGASAVASLWFLMFSPPFYHTFNHTGATVLLIGILYCLVAYLQESKRAHFIAALPMMVMLALVKFNIGVVVMLAFFLPIIAAKRYRKNADQPEEWPMMTGGFLFVAIATVLCHAWALRGLPPSAALELLPLFNKGHTGLHSLGGNVLQFFNLYRELLTSGKIQILLALLVTSAFLKMLFNLSRQPREERSKIILPLIALALAYLFLLHEYLMTGIFYRIFWGAPLTILFMFVFIDRGTANFSRLFRVLLYTVLVTIIVTQYVDRYTYLQQLAIDGRQYWDHPKARIFVNNDPSWIRAVNGAAGFLERELGPSEQFLALPYEPMLYFLTDRDSPVARLIFYEFDSPDPTEEREIIDVLEKKKVRWIAVSNDIHPEEQENFGTFGVTHCRDLARYIETHFRSVATFGDFDKPGEWGAHHAVRILKREEASLPQ